MPTTRKSKKSVVLPAQPIELEIRIANGKFKLEKKLGNGAFGDVYLATNLHSRDEEKVAVKMEPTATKTPQLIAEAKLYKCLEGGIGVPKVRWYGVEGEFNVMIMDLLGPSLEDVFKFCGRKLSVKSCLMLADQIISRLEFIHSKSYIHRDIKPENFMMGVGKAKSDVYIIDFGLAQMYRNPKTGRHKSYRENNGMTGTARFASINQHLGIEMSRRDDLEAVGYTLMYLNRGSLPWMGLPAVNKEEKENGIKVVKMETTVEKLCKHFPEEFATYLKYSKGLAFDEKPNYAYLRRMFRDLFLKSYSYDEAFDWTILQAYPQKSKTDEGEKDETSIPVVAPPKNARPTGMPVRSYQAARPGTAPAAPAQR